MGACRSVGPPRSQVGSLKMAPWVVWLPFLEICRIVVTKLRLQCFRAITFRLMLGQILLDIFVCVCVCVCALTDTHICVYLCICVYTYIYTNISIILICIYIFILIFQIPIQNNMVH